MPDVQDAASRLDLLLSDLEQLIRFESPSDDRDAIAGSGRLVAALGTARLGCAPETIAIDGRTHLRWRIGEGPRRVLVVAHHDTVWPIGTLERLPFSIVDDVLRGPGCFDMKTGLAMAFHALAMVQESGSLDGTTLLVTGDEELGSPSSRALIEAEAAGCSAALVLEASGADGGLKTERKGVSRYRVEIIGRAAHAGLEPERGVNAGIELAYQLLAINDLGDAGLGTTVTPTALTAGTTGNTVPGTAQLTIDVRVGTVIEQVRVDQAMHALTPRLAGSSLTIRGGPNRPPLDPASSASLFELAQRLATENGMPSLTSVAVGGASDGNFTAGMGVPTLDGLGAVGGGAHAEDEHVLISMIPQRTALLAALVAELTKESAHAAD